MPRVSNLYQIEGIDDDERTGLLQILIPPAEAIQSVDISTNNYEAELGRSVGAITNVTLKSGTSQFHGSAFEFIQNNAVNARSYFAGPLGHLSYNYFGGTLGGPIIKDKLFFFGDYLRTVDHEAISSTFTIPDARYYTANGSGNIDLSAALVGTKGQIYDPATGDGSAGASAHPVRKQSASPQQGQSGFACHPPGSQCSGCEVWKTRQHQAVVRPHKQLHNPTFRSPRLQTATT